MVNILLPNLACSNTIGGRIYVFSIIKFQAEEMDFAPGFIQNLTFALLDCMTVTHSSDKKEEGIFARVQQLRGEALGVAKTLDSSLRRIFRAQK